MKKESVKWWDSQSLWVVVGIVCAISMDKIGVGQQTYTVVMGLVGTKVGQMLLANVKATKAAK